MSVESYLATVQRMVQWALRDINNLIARTDMTNPDAARDALQAELPALISVWGEAAATVAAEYFEELIDAQAVLADPVDESVVQSMVGWAVGPLYGELVPRLDENGEPVLGDNGEPIVDKTPPDPSKAARNLQGASRRHIQDTGRNTIRYSAESTPGVGWARVLRGEEDCAWCVVMASRGAVFQSRQTASMVSSKDPIAAAAHLTHNHCDCDILPIRTDADYPAGYSPDKYYDQYREARKRAGVKGVKGGKHVQGKRLSEIPDSEKDILQLMREMYGMH